MSKCTKHCSPLARTEHLEKVFDNDIPRDVTISTGKLHRCYASVEDGLDDLAQVIADNYFGKNPDVSKQLVKTAIDIVESVNTMIIQCGLREKFEEASYESYENNLTKVCHTEEDARKTLEMYLEKGAECEATKNFEGNFVIKRIVDKKVVKPISYKSVEL